MTPVIRRIPRPKLLVPLTVLRIAKPRRWENLRAQVVAEFRAAQRRR